MDFKLDFPEIVFTMVYTIVVHLYAKADKEAISKLKAKLVEASQVYSKVRTLYTCRNYLYLQVT